MNRTRCVEGMEISSSHHRTTPRVLKSLFFKTKQLNGNDVTPGHQAVTESVPFLSLFSVSVMVCYYTSTSSLTSMADSHGTEEGFSQQWVTGRAEREKEEEGMSASGVPLAAHLNRDRGRQRRAVPNFRLRARGVFLEARA